jgi:predicted esterase
LTESSKRKKKRNKQGVAIPSAMTNHGTMQMNTLLAKLPMCAYYGGKDRVVPADRGEMIMKAIGKAGGKQAKLFILDDMGHNAGRVPYSQPEFFKWLFSHKRKK